MKLKRKKLVKMLKKKKKEMIFQERKQEEKDQIQMTTMKYKMKAKDIINFLKII